MDWINKRVFVTGGAGFIGSHLSKRLAREGAHVYFFIHHKYPEMPVKNPFIGDLTSKNQLAFENYLKDLQPEVVFHLAAQPLVSIAAQDELPTLRINIEGTYNLLHSLKGVESVKSVVHVSTDKVFGNQPVIQKDSPLQGETHPYNASKAVGDVITQMYANYFEIPTVIVRHANVYGAGDTHFDRIIPRTIKQVLDGKPPVIRGDGSNTRDYIHVDDVVEAYLKASELPLTQKLSTLNIGGFNHSVAEVVHEILGKLDRIDLSPKYESQWKGEIPHQHIATEEEWKPNINLDIGLDMTIGWYKENYGN